jgi:predicted TIM-barrel fold metal-dependent hydrolase
MESMRTITLEEHFVTESFIRATGSFGPGAPPQLAAMRPKLLDLGRGRIDAMDEGEIDLQVLSLAAMGFDALNAATATPLARDVNDEAAAAVRANPGRLAAFACLALKDPESAARELERCIQQLNFPGVLLDGTTGGLFLDHPRFTPVFEAAVALNVPIYLHPAPPPESVFDTYFTGLPQGVGHILSIAGWGWHAETALHTLRLIASGVLDRFPSLQLILGHMGEMLPMALARTSLALSHVARLRQPVADYFQTNIHLTTSGYFTQPPLRCALDVVGIDRLMFSVDYPFSPTTKGRAYLAELEPTFSSEDFGKLTHRNAETLLRLAQTPPASE